MTDDPHTFRNTWRQWLAIGLFLGTIAAIVAIIFAVPGSWRPSAVDVLGLAIYVLGFSVVWALWRVFLWLASDAKLPLSWGFRDGSWVELMLLYGVIFFAPNLPIGIGLILLIAGTGWFLRRRAIRKAAQGSPHLNGGA